VQGGKGQGPVSAMRRADESFEVAHLADGTSGLAEVRHDGVEKEACPRGYSRWFTRALLVIVEEETAMGSSMRWIMCSSRPC